LLAIFLITKKAKAIIISKKFYWRKANFVEKYNTLVSFASKTEIIKIGKEYSDNVLYSYIVIVQNWKHMQKIKKNEWSPSRHVLSTIQMEGEHHLYISETTSSLSYALELFRDIKTPTDIFFFIFEHQKGIVFSSTTVASPSLKRMVSRNKDHYGVSLLK
jgi:hypothetical protein